MRLLHPLTVLVFVLLALPSAAVNVEWVSVPNAGNACDPQADGCFGGVDKGYRISKSEVTNAHYAKFLNNKAASDPLGLYNVNMGSGSGGITRSGSPGSYSYAAIAGRGNKPVNYVSFYDSLRFTNWLNNGQGSGDTETGAYTLLGGTATPSNGATVTRNPGATIFLPSEDEWYKAAYYDGVSEGYFDYPAESDTQTTCSGPTAAANSANCAFVEGDLTDVGSYVNSESPYGTFDQGGNVWEWNEEIIRGIFRGQRGGSFLNPADKLEAAERFEQAPNFELDRTGFRVAAIPEPGTGLLVMAGALGLAGWRRLRN